MQVEHQPLQQPDVGDVAAAVEATASPASIEQQLVETPMTGYDGSDSEGPANICADLGAGDEKMMGFPQKPMVKCGNAYYRCLLIGSAVGNVT